MTAEIKLTVELPIGFEATGEFRTPKPLEPYLSFPGEYKLGSKDSFYPQIILKKIKE